MQVTAPAMLAESPVWDPRRQSLLWVDIIGGNVHRYDPATGDDTETSVGVPVGAVAVRRAGGLILAAGRGFAFLEEPAGLLRWLWAGGRGDRMNDGKCDPVGRFLAGTAARAVGGAALYRLGTDRLVTTLIENVTLSNGLGWSPDGALMYYTDTAAETVDVMDYDLATGAVRDRRTFVDLRDVSGRPDGLTVDAEGGVWIAMARGGAVRRYTPAGGLDHVIEMPVPLVTSVAFGGTDLADLYVTTSRDGLTGADLAAAPQAGAVFCVKAVGLTGQQPSEYAG